MRMPSAPADGSGFTTGASSGLFCCWTVTGASGGVSSEAASLTGAGLVAGESDDDESVVGAGASLVGAGASLVGAGASLVGAGASLVGAGASLVGAGASLVGA